MGNVVVMTDEIHERAAAVAAMSAPPAMMPRPQVGQHRGGTAPKVVIQPFGWRNHLRIAHEPGVALRQADLHALDFADVSVANELDALAEFKFGTLLRTDLENGVLPGDLPINHLSFGEK